MLMLTILENITIGEIVVALGIISGLTVLPLKVFNWYKKNFPDRFNHLENRVNMLENNFDKLSKRHEKEMKESKEERLILIRGLLACLKGLSEQGCDGPVSEAIVDIENYMIRETHK